MYVWHVQVGQGCRGHTLKQGMEWTYIHAVYAKVQYTIIIMLMYVHRISHLEKWMDGWMDGWTQEKDDVTHTCQCNMMGPKISIMITYHRVTCILKYILCRWKVTESNWHEVHMHRYTYVNKWILVMELQFCDEAWSNSKRSPEQSFWEKHVWDEVLRSADAVSIMSSWNWYQIVLSRRGPSLVQTARRLELKWSPDKLTILTDSLT